MYFSSKAVYISSSTQFYGCRPLNVFSFLVILCISLPNEFSFHWTSERMNSETIFFGMRNVALAQDAGIDGYISGERNFISEPHVLVFI